MLLWSKLRSEQKTRIDLNVHLALGCWTYNWPLRPNCGPFYGPWFRKHPGSATQVTKHEGKLLISWSGEHMKPQHISDILWIQPEMVGSPRVSHTSLTRYLLDVLTPEHKWKVAYQTQMITLIPQRPTLHQAFHMYYFFGRDCKHIWLNWITHCLSLTRVVLSLIKLTIPRLTTFIYLFF